MCYLKMYCILEYFLYHMHVSSQFTLMLANTFQIILYAIEFIAIVRLLPCKPFVEFDSSIHILHYFIEFQFLHELFIRNFNNNLCKIFFQLNNNETRIFIFRQLKVCFQFCWFLFKKSHSILRLNSAPSYFKLPPLISRRKISTVRVSQPCSLLFAKFILIENGFKLLIWLNQCPYFSGFFC